MEMQTYRAVVLHTAPVTPRMVRVTLGGAGLAGFTSTGQPDEYCDVYFPAPGETEPVLPIMVDGLQTTADGRPEPEHRHYTVRRHDGVAEQQEWGTAGSVDVRWIHEPDPEGISAALQDAARSYTRPPGVGFTWVAGENVATRLIRRYLRHELGLPGSAYGTLGYWRLREEVWMARYAELAPQLEPRIEAAEQAIADEEELDDVVQAIYEEAGLW